MKFKEHIEKYFTHIFGSPEEFPLVHRVFNIITFYGTLVGIFAVAGTLFVFEDISYFLFELLVLLYFIFFYYVSRFRKNYYYFTFYFVLIIFVTFGWFYLGGFKTGSPYYYFVLFIVIWIAEDRVKRNILMALISISLIFSITMEYFYPHSIKTILVDESEFKLDMIYSFVFCLIFLLTVIAEVFKNYKEEKNHSLNLLNQIRSDLCFARKIQQNLIPVKVPGGDNFTVKALYKPMQEVGGDFYDFIPFPGENRVGIFISDVSGHGVPAALITTMLKTYIKTGADTLAEPEAFLNYINKNIKCQLSGYFITALYAIFDYEKLELTYARAGHNPFYLVRDGQVSEHMVHGGLISDIDVPEYGTETLKLQKDDLLVFYTDGLTEAADDANVMFEEKLINLLKISKKNSMIDIIYEELVEHCGSNYFDDDICIITLHLAW